MSGATRTFECCAAGLRAYWVPLVFGSLAAVLATDPLPFLNPVAAPARVPPWATDTTPVRRPSLQPEYQVSAYTYRCSDCHRIIPSPPETQRSLTQHTEIDLQHGINTRCFNCHHTTNRDAFVDDAGQEIPWNEPWRLCARCHGPVYRDWQRGSHGRVNGYWDDRRGPQIRQRCIDCHDPHLPAFGPLAPAPAPRTLRMGHQEPGRGVAPQGTSRFRRHGRAAPPLRPPQEGP